MPTEEPEKGDKVTWNWGSGQPGGTVAETKKEGELAITSKRGNKIKKNADPSNPAVHIERSGNDVVKRASELNIVEKANGNAAADDSGDKEEAAKETETEIQNGEKRKHDEVEVDKQDEAEGQKDEPLEENAEGKTVKAKEPATKKQKKEPAKKEAAAPKGKKGAAAKKAEEKEEEEAEEKKEEAKPAEKKKPGRPKGVAPAKKQKKEPTPRATDGIGSRTRSRGTAS
ncbi:hypothetical protein PV04_07642 [Phialophora macrospora]|uniref:Hypervirulence associated protein TUDOR domain-containing protein n=1 Tax=Phialophora macrospora TaxID=1851006 RepID=A0A0D2DTA8_9EURO|nr:hypothetical protein PV04_07642 [Phialophora macrospora]